MYRSIIVAECCSAAACCELFIEGLNKKGNENKKSHAAAWSNTVIHFFEYHDAPMRAS
jgi:hypothetical protein